MTESTMPFYDGEQGWVAPEYKTPTPRYPGKHSAEGGWIFSGTTRTHFHEGEGGWVSEDTPEEPKDSGMSRAEMHSKKYHGGKRGWVAPGWEKVYNDKNDPYDSNPNLPVPSQSAQYMASFRPDSSISNGEKTIIVEIELPGVSPDNVSLEIVSQVSQKVPFTSSPAEKALVPSCSKKSTATASKNCFLLVRGYKHSKWDNRKVMDERHYGFFERALFLGNQVNKDSPMMAHLDGGILTVYISKPKQLQNANKKK
eukprot:CAMPEP_0117023064 /NCGR_PEP_ID=MMETSP0472-20121206/17254_1 /TAXON_ID=693140 ORGANISM="Tiarina fusus, Strain LIS" /NCGR_SAMPLE_ID=MMETSP0472 /ASSEMBLY_ACC=CAM_ASM_000603 /LENGTH=254 /DNA_ID=CAMNT_0004729079 /DNA_START=14 /DNA_END=778 /DNA_ORIENTATION=-